MTTNPTTKGTTMTKSRTKSRKQWNGTCAVFNGQFVDAPGTKCTKQATTRRMSSTYSVPVCESHATGPGLYRLGDLLFGWTR